MKNSTIGWWAVLIAFLCASPASAAVVHHSVRRGETLQIISWHYFGTTRKWQKIYAQNKTQLLTPNSVSPGLTLSFEGPTRQEAEHAREILAVHPDPEIPALARADQPAPTETIAPGTSSAEEIGSPVVQPDYIQEKSGQRPKNTENRKNDSAQNVGPNVDEDLQALVTTSVSMALESAERIRDHWKPAVVPQRKIAKSGESFKAIDPDDDSRLETQETPAENAAESGTVPSVTQKKVSYRFGSHQLVGPEF